MNHLRCLLRERYQPIVLPWFTIPPRNHPSILDARVKLPLLKLPNLRGRTVLDIGCAEGFFAIHAARQGAARVIGCDIIPARIWIARLTAAMWRVSRRCKFHLMSLDEIPDEFASDVVFCFSLVHHLQSKPTAVERIAALTKNITVWEWCIEYPPRILPTPWGHYSLGHKGLGAYYDHVKFIGFSQQLPYKDRAVYHAYK